MSPGTHEGDVPTDVPDRVAVRPGAHGLRRRTRVGRAMSAVALLGLTGAVIATGVVQPALPPVPVPALAVGVPAPSARLVCPGPVRLATEPEPGEDVVYDPQFDPAPVASAATLSAVSVAPPPAAVAGPPASPAPEAMTAPAQPDSPGTPGPPEAPASGALHPLGDDDDVRVSLDAGPAATAAQVPGLDSPLVVRADPGGRLPAWVAAAVAVTTPQGDLRGLAAASCQRPAADLWVVGGSTEIGSGARLVLQNAGRTAATVQVQLWAAAGPVELAGAQGYLVPPGTERAVLLEGVAAEQRRIVARLTVTGGQVAAYLQDSRLRGLVPAGVDLVVPGQPPADRQVVTGISVVAAAPGGADPGVLRLLAPGPDDATVRVSFLGQGGSAPLPGGGVLELESGVVLDVPLGELPPGDYTAVVEADAPVVAGALLTRGAGVGAPAPPDGSTPATPLDRAWAPSVPVGTPGVLALPAGSAGRLTVGVVPDGRDTPASVTVQAVLEDGTVTAPSALTVPAATTAAVPLDALAGDDAAGRPPVAGVVLRTEDRRVAWGAVLVVPGEGGADLVSVLAPVAPSPPQPEVSVRVR